MGVLWLIGLYILHVPLAPIWAGTAAVLQIVPHLGPILGLLGPVLAATIMWRDWEHPVGVLIVYAVVVVIDGLLLQPYIMRRTAKVPIWASIFAPIVLSPHLCSPYCTRTKRNTKRDPDARIRNLTVENRRGC